MTKIKSVAVVGAGGWGTALAIVLAENHPRVDMWVREHEVIEEIRRYGENKSFLPSVRVPSQVQPSNDVKKIVVGKSMIIMAAPSKYLRDTMEMVRPHLEPNTIIVNAAKGFDRTTYRRLSETIIESTDGQNPVAVISGPNHAEETGKKAPSATVVSSSQQEVAEAVQDALMTPYFRVYTNPDVVGVELGGALKNIIAVAVGISDGLEFGDNTKAALMTRGLTEITRLGKALGANSLTFAGLSGVGDLIVTCTSQHSRNRRCGMALGQGMTLDEYMQQTNMVVEGVGTCQVAYQLGKSLGIEMPITTVLHNVLFDGLDPKQGVRQLMERQRTREIEEIGF